MLSTPSVKLMVKGNHFVEKVHPQMIFFFFFYLWEHSFCPKSPMRRPGGLLFGSGWRVSQQGLFGGFSTSVAVACGWISGLQPPDSCSYKSNLHSLSVNEYLDKPNKAPVKMAWSQNGRSDNPRSHRGESWPFFPNCLHPQHLMDTSPSMKARFVAW